MTRMPGRDELAYLSRAARWEFMALGASLGLVFAVWAHLRPLPMPLAVVLGTTGIAIGAAFALDDPAATSLQAVPSSIRRRLGLRASLAGVVATAALGYLVAAAWTPLRFGDIGVELAGLVALSLAAGAVAVRNGRSLAGISGAATVTSVLAADSLVLSRHVLVSGGAGGAAPGWWTALAVVCLVGFLVATRDPAAPRPAYILRWRRPPG